MMTDSTLSQDQMISSTMIVNGKFWNENKDFITVSR